MGFVGNNNPNKSQNDISYDMPFDRMKLETHSVGPANVSFENFVESTKILDRAKVSKVFFQYETINSAHFSVEVVEHQELIKDDLNVSSRELSELSLSKKIQSLKKAMPE